MYNATNTTYLKRSDDNVRMNTTSTTNIRKKMKAYTMFIFIVLAIIIGLQLTTWYFVSSNKGVARIINLAGRQRMLSQKLAKQIFSNDFPLLKKNIYNDLKNWQFIHIALQTGNDSLHIPRLKYQNIKLQFNHITPFIENIVYAMQQYEADNIDQKGLQKIVDNNEKAFLSGMDAIVFGLEDKIEAHNQLINIVGVIKSVIITGLLLVIFLFMIKPFAHSLTNYVIELDESQKVIEAQNEELTHHLESLHHQNEELQTTEEELRATLDSQHLLNEQLNEQLRITSRQRQQMHNAQQLAGLGYWSYNLQHTMEWSDTMYDLYDIAHLDDTKKPSIKHYLKNIHPDDVAVVSRNLQQVVQCQQLHFTHRIIHSNGKVKTVTSLLKTQYLSDNQEPVAVFGVVYDITEQVKQAQSLEKFNESLQQVVNFSSEANQDFDQSIQNILVYTTQLLDLQVAIISSIQEDDYAVDYWYSNSPGIVLEKGQVFPFKNTYCEITYKHDRLISIEDMEDSLYSGHPCYQAFGLECYIGIPIKINGVKRGTINFSSVKKRKTAFEEYEKDYVEILSRILAYVLERSAYVEKLENLNQNQKNILHVVAHDLRAPFASLYSTLELMKTNQMTQERREKFFKLAEKEYSSGMNLMADMLESFSLEAVDQDQKEQYDISGFLTELVKQNLDKITKQNIQFKSSILPNIKAQIYPVRFQRAIENLMSNAVKFTPANGQIHLILLKDKDYFQVVVADTGIGIPKDIQPLLFEKFNKRIKRQGLNGEKTTGLGMSIVKQIVDQHNGNILVDSEEDKGTTITLKIPFQ